MRKKEQIDKKSAKKVFQFVVDFCIKKKRKKQKSVCLSDTKSLK